MSICRSWCSDMPLSSGRYSAMSFWQSQISFFIFCASAMARLPWPDQHLTTREVPDLDVGLATALTGKSD
jgi:hypothetical protein